MISFSSWCAWSLLCCYFSLPFSVGSDLILEAACALLGVFLRPCRGRDWGLCVSSETERWGCCNANRSRATLSMMFTSEINHAAGGAAFMGRAFLQCAVLTEGPAQTSPLLCSLSPFIPHRLPAISVQPSLKVDSGVPWNSDAMLPITLTCFACTLFAADLFPSCCIAHLVFVLKQPLHNCRVAGAGVWGISTWLFWQPPWKGVLGGQWYLPSARL